MCSYGPCWQEVRQIYTDITPGAWIYLEDLSSERIPRDVPDTVLHLPDTVTAIRPAGYLANLKAGCRISG